VQLDSGDCVPISLKNCPDRRVIEVFTQALRDGDMVPACKLLYDVSPFITWLNSNSPNDMFSYIQGEVHSYEVGERHTIDTSSVEAFMRSAASLQYMENDHTHPAKLFLIFVYTPTLKSVLVFRMLIENTMSGSLIATWKREVVHLEGYNAWRSVVNAFTIFLAILCFVMELRRILGCPKACTFEQNRDRCSLWLFVFLLLPAALMVDSSMRLTREDISTNTDKLIQFEPGTESLSTESIKSMYHLTLVEYWRRVVHWVVLILLSSLWLRYLLMFFPQLFYMTSMVTKVKNPLFYVLLCLVGAFLVLGTFLYVMFSSTFPLFRSYFYAVCQAIEFTQGTFEGWYVLYEEHEVLWTIIVILALTLIRFMLNNMVVAVMMSHKKEKDLRQNYSYHRFWAAEASKRGKSKEEFNPATIGENFKESEKERAR